MMRWNGKTNFTDELLRKHCRLLNGIPQSLNGELLSFMRAGKTLNWQKKLIKAADTMRDSGNLYRHGQNIRRMHQKATDDHPTNETEDFDI